MASSERPGTLRSRSGRAARTARRRAEHLQQSGGQRAGIRNRGASGEQKLQQLAVVDGLAPGAQQARLEPAAAARPPGPEPAPDSDPGAVRRRHVEECDVVEAGFGCVQRGHATASRDTGVLALFGAGAALLDQPAVFLAVEDAVDTRSR